MQTIIDESDAINILLNGLSLTSVVSDNVEWVNKFNKVSVEFDLPISIDIHERVDNIDDYVNSCKQNWNLPEYYTSINIEAYLLNKCGNDIEKERVQYELQLFKEHDMLDVIKFLIYFIDTLRKHKVIWGVGRGSSVSSYILYLIGVHKIDSIKYDLNPREFLK